MQQQQRRKSTGRLHAGKERHPLTVPSARRVCMVAHAPLFLRAGRRASTRALPIDKADMPAELMALGRRRYYSHVLIYISNTCAPPHDPAMLQLRRSPCSCMSRAWPSGLARDRSTKDCPTFSRRCGPSTDTLAAPTMVGLRALGDPERSVSQATKMFRLCQPRQRARLSHFSACHQCARHLQSCRLRALECSHLAERMSG